jgi:hypothetical protein
MRTPLWLTYGLSERPAYWRQFREAVRNARARDIEFLLTYSEWLKIWQDSGHLSERGKKLGQYVMARFGDKGPYAVGNVRIIATTENLAEGRERQLDGIAKYYGRPPLGDNTKAVQIRLHEDLFVALEGWRRKQETIPSRPQAIRELIALSLNTDLAVSHERSKP